MITVAAITVAAHPFLHREDFRSALARGAPLVCESVVLLAISEFSTLLACRSCNDECACLLGFLPAPDKAPLWVRRLGFPRELVRAAGRVVSRAVLKLALAL